MYTLVVVFGPDPPRFTRRHRHTVLAVAGGRWPCEAHQDTSTGRPRHACGGGLQGLPDAYQSENVLNKVHGLFTAS